ncbi:extracellular solute-binding protein [Streptosporangium vulgare]
MERFNKANPNGQIEFTAMQNDAYKTKIKTAIGAGQAPTIIWGWGGGTLRTYVQAGQVEDLTSWFEENAAVKDRLFPSSFGAATIDGKIYAMPAETMQPIVLYYNKKVFEQVGVEPPQSWGDIMALVPKFNAAGIAPFSLGGQSRWTNMMWLEFLFDRIGGPEVFQGVFDAKKDAWSHPAAIEALTKLQDLVKAKGFIKGFSSITADSNADQALLYTGKAAMMLHGGWTYGSMSADGGDFVSGGHLGYMNFPPVEGGKGDPSNTVGNPGQYLSISSKATPEQKEIAKKFFATAVLNDEDVKEWAGTGAVPIVNGADSAFAGAKDEDFLKFVYGIASNAKSFAQSWDQALSPTAAEVLLDNISKLFQLSITPEQFVSNMNAVIGS